MIKISDIESKVLGLKIARADASALEDTELLRSKLIEQEIDILKLQFKNPGPDLYLLLDALGYRYYVLGIVVDFKAVFKRYKDTPYLNQGLSFDEYTGGSEFDFKEFVRTIFKDSPSSFFINPGLKIEKLKEHQLEVFATYVSGLHGGLRKDHFAHILKQNDRPIGFITSYCEDDGGGVSYAGILPEYVGKGLFIDLVNFIHRFGISIGQKWGRVSVELQNNVAVKTYIRAGLILEGYTLNVHVNCRDSVS